MLKLPWLLWQLVTQNRRACAAIRNLEGIQLGFVLILLRWLPTWGITFLAFVLGRRPFVQPYLPIPAENYYYAQIFMLLPAGVLLWILTAGVAQTCVITLRGSGRYKDTLNYCAMTSLLLAPIVWGVDLTAIMLDLWRAEIIIPVHTAVAAAEAVLYSAGMRNLHGLSVPVAILVGVLAMVAYRPFAVLILR